MGWIILVSLIVCSTLALAGDLAGWKVVRVTITDKEEMINVHGWDLDVWSHDSNLVLGANDIRVNDTHLNAIEKLGLNYEVLINDLDTLMEEQAKTYVNETSADWFASWHTYDEFTAYFNNLTVTYPTLIKKKTLGTSIQGRNIDSYIITGTGTGAKKRLVFTGGQHAREWISPATVAFLSNNLVSLYATDSSVKTILDNLQFYIVPIVNPDGYAYTWTGSANRLWRKNRRANAGGTYGVDLNRNWNDHWGGTGSSGTPSSDTYRGTAAFSEPETKLVSDYILANVPFAGYIDFHSYGELILRPYGWTNALPPDSAVQKAVGDQIRDTIRSISGKVYTSEPAHQLYFTSGTADDWAYGVAKAKLTYTIEMRDTGTYGFQLPANQIIPTGQEIWGAIKYYSNYAINNN